MEVVVVVLHLLRLKSLHTKGLPAFARQVKEELGKFQGEVCGQLQDCVTVLAPPVGRTLLWNSGSSPGLFENERRYCRHSRPADPFRM